MRFKTISNDSFHIFSDLSLGIIPHQLCLIDLRKNIKSTLES